MDIPRPRYARRAFYFVTILICALLGIIQFFVIPVATSTQAPSLGSVLSSLAGALLTSIVSGVLIATLLFWLIPTSDEKTQAIEVIAAYERTELHEQSRADTQIWWYTGATARYNRAITLPDLARRARLANASKGVVLLLIDPDNIDICTHYANWRNGLRSTKASHEWDTTRVRCELLATILCAHSWSSQEPFLDITIGLKQEWSVLRVDMSSRLALVTVEDTRYPALKCGADGFYYNILREDFRLRLSQTRKVPMDVVGVAFEELTPDTARRTLGTLGLRLDGLSASDLQRIVALARTPENPYA